MTIRVTLADHHPVVLEGLASILGKRRGVEVLSRDSDGDSALASILEWRPDIAFLDAAMPEMGGVEILKVIRDRALPTRVVLLAGELGSEDLIEALRLGVDGILMKDEAARVLLACVESLNSGARWVSASLLERALDVAARNGSNGHSLTPREAEIAESVAQGLQNKEIAERLGIANGTVRIHVHNVFKKFGVQNRVELSNRIRGEKQNPST
jgi:two-component system NarL family response regulator/two-component system nitrate/nitrite response regulator NarL